MKFKWAEPLGNPECPYVIRWVADFGLFSVRIHKWLGPDDRRYFHDHEWWYVSWIVKGSYMELTPGWFQFHLRERWSVKYYPATHQHTIVPTSNTWTILLTGPKVRNFGFWVNGKFRKRNKYFFEHGHHPCE